MGLWIGWDFRYQYDRLKLLINNRRFLIFEDGIYFEGSPLRKKNPDSQPVMTAADCPGIKAGVKTDPEDPWDL